MRRQRATPRGPNMATNENKAAAIALANASPIAASTGPAAASAIAAVPAELRPASGAVAAADTPASPADEPKTGKVPWTEWDTVKKEKAKAKEREAKAEQALAEAASVKAEALAEVERSRKHPVFEALSKKDPAGAIRAYAKENGITFQKAMDELTYQLMNDGKRPPEAEVADVRSELEKYKAEQAKLVEERTKTDEASQAQGMKQGFTQWAMAKGAEYPILAVQDPADVAEASYVIANRIKGERNGIWPTREEVAAELEASARAYFAKQAAAFQKFQALTGATGQGTGKPEDAASPELAEGTGDLQPEGGAAQVRTLTNGSAARRGPPAELKTREDRRRAAMKLLG